MSLDMLLLKGPPSGHIEGGLNELRYTILIDGIPQNSEGMSELRMYVWLIFLNAPPLRTDVYLDLVRQGASPAHTKILNDAFRTFQGDPLFRRRVTQNSITRVLNAVAWRLNDAHEARVNGWQSPPTLSEFGGSPDTTMMSRHSLTTGARTDASTTNDAEQIGYVQGMNVLAGPFLYAARSEVEAFTGFERLITQECPGYVRGSMEGVHKGLDLVDRVLKEVDPKLFDHLMHHHMYAKIYAFASVLTMSACTPPLTEVLRLWDFLFAYGPHMNILCIVVQLVLIRDQILTSSSPNQLLRNLPGLDARKIIPMAMTFAGKIPEDLYEEILNHAK
ncbi:rab-GTPase-TBC domain-domain-containing protein [Clohesyomyces aquaticus]|uniref:Rab-GTPase-TBC domain-domain-containing protein n=1 Tax=Clohesyomyces aquaticus TaxID=1231657 RepID=A0A1Y1ZDD9_9PLEO|nr:rab-GTPase-TBC domain-domain-containing protein [Clohesyomyces aquaticus]